MRKDDLYRLPEGITAPPDDGACDHLTGMKIPLISLRSTSGRWVDLRDAVSRRTVIYCYPRTGRPDQEPAGGLEKWNAIPGARGCTPQSCAFRDHMDELRAFDVEVFGLSTQSTGYQREMAQRLKLPFEVLSDSELAFTRAMGLPTFEFDSETLLKRLTLIIVAGRIVKVFYPVFPPDKNAEAVIAWLSQNAA